MAFSSAAGGSAPSVNVGAELEEIETEGLGFKAFAGDKKLKLLPQPWPTENLPPSSASLLAVASKRGYLAAAGPESLIVASTDAVRTAYRSDADENNVIQNFKPDAALPFRQLRHVAFSSDEMFLVVAAEKGGLAVHNLEIPLNRKDDFIQIAVDPAPVRALIPNPNPQYGSLFAVVLDSGRLALVDLAQQQVQTLHQQNVTCVAWSNMGKALVAGLEDGSAVQYKGDGKLMATVPCPPDVDSSYAASAVFWLSNDEFFIIHSPKADPSSAGQDDMEDMEQDNLYHLVRSDKSRSNFTFHKAPGEIFFESFGPKRTRPLRFSVNRLRNWKPTMNDLLIVAASHSEQIKTLTNTSVPLSSEQPVVDQYTITNVSDSRRAELPNMVTGDEETSVLLGEALDLSSKDKVVKPIPSDDEYKESPGPLPAYLALNNEGMLCAWWVVYDTAIRESVDYPGLAVLGGQPAAATPSSTRSSTSTSFFPKAPSSTFGQTSQPTAAFGKPAFGQLAQPAFGKPAFGQPAQPAFGKPAFGQPSQPASGASVFGQPSQPSSGTPKLGQTPASSFGKPAFGQASQPSASPFSKPGSGQPSQPSFGKPSFGQPSQPSFGKPSFGQPSPTQPSKPAFGQPSFGQPSQPAANPFAAKPGAQPSSPLANPFAAKPGAQSPSTAPNPFAAKAGSESGFAKFGSGNGFATSPSAASPFSGLSGQKSAFSGASNQPSLSKETSATKSFGSMGSSFGGSMPSWAKTPAEGSIFGETVSSFASSKESEMSDANDAQNRERNEATPTPQPAKTLFGGPPGGFKLGSTFKGDGSAKDDLPKPKKPAGDSLFGDAFASALGTPTSKPPETPTKEEERKLLEASTTPAKPPPQFASTTPKGPEAALPSPEDSVVPEDAPLSPDPMTFKPKKDANDDLPPLAGSPPIKVEPVDSDVPESPVEEQSDSDSELSVEEQDEDEEESESDEEGEIHEEDEDGATTPPPDTKEKSKSKDGWSFQGVQESVTNSPQIRPAAPTPPALPSSGSTSAPFSFLNKSAQPSSLFPTSATPSISKPIFPAPADRRQENLRSPSPMRSASTGALGARRQSPFAPGSPLSASIRAARPPTPQPELSDLSDDDDERIRRELASDVEPSRYLDDFLAHQDYTGTVSKIGTAAQIEIMYRDMNSMVDTMGLNARSLQSFTLWHAERKEVGREDLEDVLDGGEDGPWFNDWHIAQIEDLKSLEDQLEAELDTGRVQNVVDKLSELTHLLRDKAKLMTRLNDIRRQIINRKDPERVESLKKAPLPKELAELQQALRKDYAQLLSLLSQAEEAAFMLKSKLASSNAGRGKTGAVPTVDNVKRTISRLIQMTEKKCSDIALLESQLRKLGGEGANGRIHSSPRTPARSSRLLTHHPHKQSPAAVATPPSRMSLSELNRTVQTPEQDDTPNKGYGLFYTPPGSPTTENGVFDLSKLARDLEDMDAEGLVEASRMRRSVADTLRSVMAKRKVRVTRVGQRGV